MLIIEGTYKIAMWIRSRRIDKDKRRIYLRKNDKIVKEYLEMQAKLSKKYETFEGKYDKNASLIIKSWENWKRSWFWSYKQDKKKLLSRYSDSKIYLRVSKSKKFQHWWRPKYSSHSPSHLFIINFQKWWIKTIITTFANMPNLSSFRNQHRYSKQSKQ